jgi:hypothetical protein
MVLGKTWAWDRGSVRCVRVRAWEQEEGGVV